MTNDRERTDDNQGCFKNHQDRRQDTDSGTTYTLITTTTGVEETGSAITRPQRGVPYVQGLIIVDESRHAVCISTGGLKVHVDRVGSELSAVWSAPFDVCVRVSEPAAIRQLTGNLASDLDVEACGILVGNLVHHGLTGASVGIGLAKSSLVPPRRYIGGTVGYQSLRRAVDLLQQRGLIHLEKGSQLGGRRSRLWMTDQLADRLRDLGSVWLQVRPWDDELVLKNRQKKMCDYRNTRERDRLRKRIRKFNALMADVSLELLPGAGANAVERSMLTTHKSVYRVFNNGHWNQGGRFYGGGWQQLSGANRRRLLINGEPVVELDYKALHPTMLYHMAGVDPEGDVYGFEGLVGLRPLGKIILLVALNAANRRKAIGAVRDKVREDPELAQSVQETGRSITELYDLFLARHEPIAHQFGSGIGIKLQYLDSVIMDRLIAHFADMDVPCLSVHDSAIVPVHYEEELRERMLAEYERVFGFPIRVTRSA